MFHQVLQKLVLGCKVWHSTCSREFKHWINFYGYLFESQSAEIQRNWNFYECVMILFCHTLKNCSISRFLESEILLKFIFSCFNRKWLFDDFLLFRHSKLKSFEKYTIYSIMRGNVRIHISWINVNFDIVRIIL